MSAKLTAHWWFLPSLAGLALIALLWLGPLMVGVLPVYLWTDRLIFLLVIMTFFLVGVMFATASICAAPGRGYCAAD